MATAIPLDTTPEWQRLFPDIANLQPAWALEEIDREFRSLWTTDDPEIDIEKYVIAIGELKPAALEPYLKRILEFSELSMKHKVKPGILRTIVNNMDQRILVGEYAGRLEKMRTRSGSDYWRREAEMVFRDSVLPDLLELPAALDIGMKLTPRSREIEKELDINRILFDETGTQLILYSSKWVAGEPEPWLYVVDRQSLDIAHAYQLPAIVSSFRRDGARAIIFRDGTGEIIDTLTGKSVVRFTLPEPKKEITNLFWLGQDAVLLLYLEERAIYRVDLASGGMERSELPITFTYDDRRQHAIKYRAFASTDGREILCPISGDPDGENSPLRFERFAVPTLKTIEMKTIPTVLGHFESFDQIPGAEQYLIAGDPGLAIFNPSTNQALWSRAFYAYSYYLTINSVSADGRWILTTGVPDRLNSARANPEWPHYITRVWTVAQIVDAQNGKSLLAIYPQKKRIDKEEDGSVSYHMEHDVYSFSLSPDGKEIVAGYNDGTISLWPLPDLEALAREERTPLPVKDWDRVLP